MTAEEAYAARIDTVRAQRARLHVAPPPDDPWGGSVAQHFRADPHRPLDANLAVLASYIVWKQKVLQRQQAGGPRR